MPTNVADQIEAWLNADSTKWELDRDVVDWVRGYSGDVARAWRECPRAEWLLAIAGAYGAPRQLAVIAVGGCARAVEQLLPPKLTLAKKAIYLAESYEPTSRAEPPKPSRLHERIMASLGDMEATTTRLGNAVTRALQRATGPVVDLLLRLLTEKEPRPAGAPLMTRDTITPEALARGAEVLEEVLALPVLNQARVRLADLHRFLARAHAARAAASCATVAESAALYDAASALARAMEDRRNPSPDEVLAQGETRQYARRAEARIYTEGALVCVHAVEAFADSAVVTSDVAFGAGMSSFVTTTLYSSKGDPPEGVELPTFRQGVDRARERARDLTRIEFANLVRMAIPIGDTPGGALDPDVARATAGDRRDTLRRAILGTLHVVRILGDAAAVDIHEAALAILEAPGPLNKKALAPVLRELHERMADMFRRRAAETTGPAHEEALRGIANAEASAEEMERVLEQRGTDGAN